MTQPWANIELRSSRNTSSALGHKGLGRVFLAKKNYAEASRELKRAEILEPSQWQIHDLLAQALFGAGEYGGAVAEYKKTLRIWPNNTAVMSKLAELLEKQGDFVGALGQYRQAAEIQHDDQMQAQYQSAEQRVNAHIQLFKSTGRSGEAAELESRLAAMRVISKNPAAEWQAAVDAGIKARGPDSVDKAQALFESAVALTEKLQPRDWRLIRTIGQLGATYQNAQKFSEAAAQFQRQLAVTTEVYGAQSPENGKRP